MAEQFLHPRSIPVAQLARIVKRKPHMVAKSLRAQRANFTGVGIDCASALAWINKLADFSTDGTYAKRFCEIHLMLPTPTIDMINDLYPNEAKTTLIMSALTLSTRLAAYTNLLLIIRPSKLKKRFNKRIEHVGVYEMYKFKVLAYCCKCSMSDVADWSIKFYLANFRQVS